MWYREYDLTFEEHNVVKEEMPFAWVIFIYIIR